MALSPDQYKQRFIEKWAAALILQSEYKGSAKPITVLCMTCGSSCDKPAGEALRYGCVHCSRKANVKRGREARIRPDNLTALFITRLREKHGDKYRLIGPYVDAKTAVRLQCSCGREFSARPDDLLYGPRGCNCELWRAREEARNRPKPEKPEPLWNQEKFEAKVREIWGDEFVILGEYRNMSKLLKVKHSVCGRVFDKRPESLLNNHGCRYCSRNSMSAAVIMIDDILRGMVIEYKREVRMEGCRYKNPLFFDFGIYHQGQAIGLIEYDGEQHFRMSKYLGGERKLALVQKRDAIKTAYCKTHDIPLLRLDYRMVQGKGTAARAILTGHIVTFIEGTRTGISTGNL